MRMMRGQFDLLATRRGFLVTAVVICLGAFSLAVASSRSAGTIRGSQAELQVHQMSRSYSALNDLIRLQQAFLVATHSEWSAEQAVEQIQSALDILYVRSDHIESRLERLRELNVSTVENDLRNSGALAMQSLRDLVMRAEEALQTDDPVAVFSSPEMIDLVSDARRAVYRYLDETTLMEERALDYQASKVLRMNEAIYVFLGLTTLAALFCLVQLRWEVVARKERERAEKRAEHLAYFDPLTGLANRVHFKNLVDLHLQTDLNGSMVLIDIDGFKDINERHGHAFGDAVLRQVGRVIRSEAEANNGVAARLGADEFAVFLRTDNTAFLRNFCQSLLHDCGRTLHLGGLRLHPSICVGMATTSQLTLVGRTSYDELVRVTDFALSAARSGGRGRMTLYDADLEALFKERRAMMKELPHAIREGKLDVYLQPKVDLRDASVRGFEALVRWRRGGRVVPPGEFIAVAEECGRIVDIDKYVLECAVGTVAAWNRRYRTRYSVSVNLSGVHFGGDPDLDFVSKALAESRLDSELLTLEITESVQLSNWDAVGQTVSALRAKGCRISIDDFGTGYSSLAYLTTISADELKIDKSLVDKIDTSGEARFILDAVLDLAKSLKLEVVVEGIERETQRQQLLGYGCQFGQGFLFGRPQPANDALADATFGLSRPSATAAG